MNKVQTYFWILWTTVFFMYSVFCLATLPPNMGRVAWHGTCLLIQGSIFAYWIYVARVHAYNQHEATTAIINKIKNWLE
jgi:hypothetical protein